MKSSIYKVAGFLFRIDSLEEHWLPEALVNLLPFRVREFGPFLFSLQIVEKLPEIAWKPLFKTDDGPGFPEITIETYEDKYRFSVSILPGKPVAGFLVADKDFRLSQLQLTGTDDSFALNNALMLLFAFASARKGALEMHASVVMQDGKGYLFLGKSGTGKSTHSSLWLKHIPGTELLNDDNPILKLEADGSVRVYGSPWSGKTPCYKAKDVPVGAVVRIRQAPENRIEHLSGLQAYASLMASASSFRPFKELADGWHRTLEALASKVPCFILDCLPDQAAAELCYKTVHG
jgi:hypothetical protein